MPGILTKLLKGSGFFNTTQNTIDIDLGETVDLSRTFVIIQVRSNQADGDDLEMEYYGNYGIGTYMFDNDTLRIIRDRDFDGFLLFNWYVFELGATYGLEVETGFVQFNSNPKDVALLTISGVDDLFTIGYFYSESGGFTANFDEMCLYHSVIYDENVPTLRIRGSYPLSSPNHRLYYQVIRNSNWNITKMELTSIPKSPVSNNYDLPAAIDLTKSMTFWNCFHQDGSVPSPSPEHIKSVYLLDNDTIRVRAYAGFAAPYACCYIFDTPIGSISELDRGQATLNGEDVNIDVAATKDSDWRYTHLSQCYNCWSGSEDFFWQDFKNVGTKIGIVDNDTFEVQRGDQGTLPETAYLTYEDIEFGLFTPTLSADYKRFPTGFARGLARGMT